MNNQEYYNKNKQIQKQLSQEKGEKEGYKIYICRDNRLSWIVRVGKQMNSYIIWLIFIPGLIAIFMFTKASFMDFLLGFGLCLLGEAIVVICYCVVKVQQALIDSGRIKLEQNYNLNVQKQYPFRDRKQVGKLFLNKYTQEEKLETKKNTLKVHSFQNYLSEEEILNQEPKRQILRFLKQKHSENNYYNCFNRLLITLGQSLSALQYSSKLSLITKKYSFQTIQSRSPCEINQKQLQNEERQLLDQLEIKIMIKKDHYQNIVLPSWTVFIDGLHRVGLEFLKIQQMHDSNQQIIHMVKTKIIEDFQFIQREIKASLNSLDKIQKTSLQLKKENDDFLSNERNIAEHQMDFMLLLKQHYYKYQDFQLRIKENQKNYHLQTKKLSYFREKLSTFYRKNREKYQKIFKTRFFAIFDSYNITIDESIKVMRTVLKMSHTYQQNKPPKVNKLETHKNVDHQIEAERKYQQEYFQRARFYHQLSEQLMRSVQDMGVFLEKVEKMFGSLCETLSGIEKQLNLVPQSQRTFTYMLIMKFSQIIAQLSRQAQHLLGVHWAFKQTNVSCLVGSQSRTIKLLDSASQLLNQLQNPRQPLQYKYKLVKIQLQSYYQQIQEQIKEIKRFQCIYNEHSNRVKKVLMIQILYFLQLQKLYINESDFIKQSITADWITHNQLTVTALGVKDKDPSKQENNEQQKQQNNYLIQSQQQSQAIDNIYTGQYLCDDYIKIINRFLFSAYSEWKNSQFFKQTLTKQLYVLLNKDENESISEVTIMNLQLLGYPPAVLSIRELHSQPFEFLADISIAFKGKLLIYLKTEYKLMGLTVPTEVKVQVEDLYCCVRICFVPSEMGQSWFSFIGEPVAKFTVQPKIYTISINVETIRNFFSTLLLNKLKESTFPIREKIMIPLSKEDPMLELIQKRLKSTYHF